MHSSNMATKKQLKIGFILDTSLDPNDGVQQYVVGLGEWFRAEGHDVHYLVGETKHRQLINIHSLSKNFSVVFNGNRTTIPLIPNPLRLRKFMRRQKFDVLHVQTPHHPLLAQPLLLFADKQTAAIGTFHILPYDTLSKVGTWLLGFVLRPSLKRLDALLAVSSAAAAFTKTTYRMNSMVLPNVVDYQRFSKAKPLERYDDDILTILFLGRLVPRKGCRLLLEAVRILAEKPDMPAFRVVICGNGPLMNDFKDFVAANGLQERVIFEGFVQEDEKPRFYASADISVFPSIGGESFGIVLLEAMASGKAAVFAGDNPGYRSVLAERSEMLFDTSSVDVLVQLLEQYLSDAELRKAASQWGETYTAKFDVNVVGKQLLTIYDEALQKRRQI